MSQMKGVGIDSDKMPVVRDVKNTKYHPNDPKLCMCHSTLSSHFDDHANKLSHPPRKRRNVPNYGDEFWDGKVVNVINHYQDALVAHVYFSQAYS